MGVEHKASQFPLLLGVDGNWQKPLLERGLKDTTHRQATRKVKSERSLMRRSGSGPAECFLDLLDPRLISARASHHSVPDISADQLTGKAADVRNRVFEALEQGGIIAAVRFWR